MAEFYMAAARRQMVFLKGSATKRLEIKIQQALTCIQTRELKKSDVYIDICIKLGSSIDTAIARNAVPSSSHIPQLFFIVKEVYRCMTELLQPSLMLLMLPIKAACRVGWFPDGDKSALLMMAKEVCYGFCSPDKMSIEPIYAHTCVSTIISRFYPTMKVENILTSFDVKAGYGIFIADFHISRGHFPRHCQNLRLLVARMDNMDTAACIASPLNVDFLINGSAVPKRTKSDMGNGPQLPSNVSKMIKYGVNILQVSGDFNGRYIIAVASMNLISSPDLPQLQDYVHPMSDRGDSECEVSEMSSQISIRCPISQCRIKVPVKGQLCKHRQCFDYKNFMKINSATPTWRCPHCDKPVCNLDIRIDQDFLKILNEVADDVTDVIISANGSRMVVMTEKRQSTETNRNITSQNNQVLDTAGNHISIEANDALPKSSLSLPGLAIIVSTERSCTLSQSTVTSPEVSPPPGFGDSRLQSQGLCGTVPMPSPMQQTRHLVNPVNSTTTHPSSSLNNLDHPSAEIQPQQGQTDNTTPNNFGQSTSEQARGTTLSAPFQRATTSPLSTALAFEQLGRGDEQQHCVTPGQSQREVVDLAFQQLRREGEQRHYTAPAQSQANIGTSKQAQTTSVFPPAQLAPSATTSPDPNASSFEHPSRGEKQRHYTVPGRHQAEVGATEQAHRTTLITSSASRSPPSIALNFEQLMRRDEQQHNASVQSLVNVGTTNQTQNTTMFTPAPTSSSHSVALAFDQLGKGGEQRHFNPVRSHPAPALSPAPATTPVPTPTSNIRSMSPTQLPELSGDAMPSGSMRGRLTGKERAAAQLEFLAPPRQPIRGNERWSLASLMQQPPPTSSQNVSSSGDLRCV